MTVKLRLLVGNSIRTIASAEVGMLSMVSVVASEDYGKRRMGFLMGNHHPSIVTSSDLGN